MASHSSKCGVLLHTDLGRHLTLIKRPPLAIMSEIKPTDASVAGTGHGTGTSRERKPTGGVLKRLRSRRSQVDTRPITEDELLEQGRNITSEDVLGLRAATRGRLCDSLVDVK